ncbi:MAG: type I 3-dehydroquinate dehydratase [Betaproteobacteria bacterium]|nr:MAG: type I 3-dehydroquinate dehydratase [Betaproteobacteria bacterium]
MNKLSKVLGTDVPLIAVGFDDTVSIQTVEDVVKRGLDVAELRIDLYSSSDEKYVLQEVKKFRHIPTVGTIRIKAEGGQWDLSEQERLSLFKAIISHVDSVDIELASKSIISDVIDTAHAAKKLVVISYHNFDRTPSLAELNSIATRAKALRADVIKVATHARSQKDIQTLASFTITNSDVRLVTIAMGAIGIVSRVFFPAIGSCITYAYAGTLTAPGQLHLDDMFELMRTMYPAFNQKKLVSLKILEFA